jgi:hypothetical protein
LKFLFYSFGVAPQLARSLFFFLMRHRDSGY